MNNPQQLFSYHVFLFPFQWKYTGEKFKDTLIEEKNKLSDFIFALKNSKWKREQFEIKTILEYNEANYFYDFVRDILYDFKKPENKDNNPDDTFIAHFEYQIPSDTVHYKIKTAKVEYKLLIDSILLHLYSTGIGVLSFHLNNRDENQSKEDDILKINQFGRRIYPPFFGLDVDITGTQAQFNYDDFKKGLEFVKYSELAKTIEIEGIAHEEFLDYTNPNNFKNGLFIIPDFIKKLFPANLLTTKLIDDTSNETKIHIAPVLDDRMFVICWYGNKEILNRLRLNSFQKGRFQNRLLLLSDDWFYKFLFVDGEFKTCQNDKMTKELLEKHTNLRWLNYGTIFGLSRYSFVCLTNDLSNLKNNRAAFLLNHVQTLYYKLVELCLVQRACILKFSDEVTEISGFIKKNEKHLSDKVSSLYKQYIRFVNKIYFREVTAQEQGIELYNLLQEHMKLKDQVKDLDDEISELHNYMEMQEQRSENKVITLLTKLTAIFLPASLIAGIFGMNSFELKSENINWNILSFSLILITASIATAIIWLNLKIKQIKR